MSDLLDADFGGELATSRFVLILFFVIFLEAVYIRPLYFFEGRGANLLADVLSVFDCVMRYWKSGHGSKLST